MRQEFYLRSALEVARDLIGKQLVHVTSEGTAKGIIVETEAYLGKIDPAAHSYKAPPTGRTAIQYREGGYAYIYTIYGLHCCMNVVTNAPQVPEVVLIRALEPMEGIPLMASRRGTQNLRGLCSGPGKLTQALGITKDDYGADLLGDILYIEDTGVTPPEISATPRINIDYAGDAAAYPWRFTWKDSPFLSVK